MTVRIAAIKVPRSQSIRCVLVYASIVVFALGHCGCNRSPVGEASGKVTLNGEAIEYGAITFSPVDGSARTSGAIVENGKYRATDVPVGEQFVHVAAGIPPDVSATSTSMPDKRARITIPASAPGNGEKHRILEGEQLLDIQLSSQ